MEIIARLTADAVVKTTKNERQVTKFFGSHQRQLQNKGIGSGDQNCYLCRMRLLGKHQPCHPPNQRHDC